MDQIKKFKKNINKLDLYKNIHNGKNIMHLLASRGEFDLLYKLLDKFPKYNVYKPDNDGNTLFHLLLQNGFCESKLFELYPESLYKVNKKGYYVLYLMLEYPECFVKYMDVAIKLYPDILTQPQNFQYDTILNKMCLYFNNKLIKKQLKLVLDKYIDINDTKYYNIFITAININSLELLKLLFSYTKDINTIFSNDNMFAYYVIKNGNIALVEELFNKFPNVNINNMHNTDKKFNAVSVCFLNFNTKIWNIIKKQKINFSVKNIFLDTLAHTVLLEYQKNKDIKMVKAIKYILENSDLYAESFDYLTPIDLIKYHKFEHFYYILDKIKHNKKNDKSNKLILSDDYKSNKNTGIFNTFPLHQYIYEYILYSKYSSLTTLYNDDNDKEDFTYKMNIYNLDLTLPQSIIKDVILFYITNNYRLLVGTIIWFDKNNYFIHDNFDLYLIKAIARKGRFVYIRISIRYVNGGHAGLILYDKILNKFIRFEPDGVNDGIVDHLEFDNLMKKRFENALKKSIIYLKPEDFMESYHFQRHSGEHDDRFSAIGDPRGYCLAWCLWWVELKILNPDIDDTELLRIKYNSIEKHQIEVGNRLLIHIRSYANKLTKQKNKFLEEIGINKLSFHNKDYFERCKNNIREELNKRFEKLFLNNK
jgi:hypothetical protein